MEGSIRLEMRATDFLRYVLRAGFGYAVALALTAVMTGLVAVIREVTDVSNVSMLYLLAVLASAVLFGSGPAIASSVAAFLAFNFFFLVPHHQLAVSNEEEWVALGLLLLTGIITGQLAAALRDRAKQAERREREAIVLYDVVRLMAEPNVEKALNSIAERLRAELDLAAVAIAFAEAAPVSRRAEAGEAKALEIIRSAEPASILGTGASPSEERRGSPGRWIRVVSPTGRRPPTEGYRDRLYKVPIRSQEGIGGVLLLVRRQDAPRFRREDDRLLSAIANQLGMAVERMELREEATRADILRRTDEVKSALLKAVSHDLRTPLSSIIASAGSLLQEDISWTEEERREFARAIEEEARRLNRLVGNLLDLSRIEAGTLRPDKGWYDLSALIDDVLGRLRGLTADHRVTVDVPGDLPPVLMDYVEIDEVVSNLIENATKYTPPGTEIAMAVRHHHDEIEVGVSDSGPGIPEDVLQHLFQPFRRSAKATQSKGTGLGLAVARGIVHAHGGRIWGENRQEGGARFVFTLPLHEPEDHPLEAAMGQP
jgi:two-component system sensor histidine kinase KdpD